LSGDWVFDSGDYTRSASTGKRVDQYEKTPDVDRIPFEKFFSEDGPHPFGLDWGYGYPYDYGYGGGYPWLDGMGEYGWGGGYPYGIPYADNMDVIGMP
jgi:hypothetical protein